MYSLRGLEKRARGGCARCNLVAQSRNTPIATPHSLRNRYGFAAELRVKPAGAPRVAARSWRKTCPPEGSGEWEPTAEPGTRTRTRTGSFPLFRLQLPGAGSAGQGRGVWDDNDVVTELGEHRRRDVAGVTAAYVEPVPQEHRPKDVHHATDTP